MGADLKYLLGLIDNLDWDGIESFLSTFQDAVMGLRYAPFPVVAAPRGMALGGGCEFCLGADARVAAAELRMGLVETRVGLIPGAGGCMEVVRSWPGDTGSGFDLVFSGRISDNAHQARGWRFLRREDPVLMSPERLLPRALEEVRKRAADYDPPVVLSCPLPAVPDSGSSRTGWSLRPGRLPLTTGLLDAPSPASCAVERVRRGGWRSKGCWISSANPSCICAARNRLGRESRTC